MRLLNNEISNIKTEIVENVKSLENNYINLNLRFEYEKYQNMLEEYYELIDKNNDNFNNLTNSFSEVSPVSEILNALNKFYEDSKSLNNNIIVTNDEIKNILSEEKRAHQQLLKLYLIINEVNTKINEYQLPSISNNYKEDVGIAIEYIRSIEDLLIENQLNINLLNSTLNEAIDYIYKLYNNVNNIVGMAVMVENAIVFANRYRSSMPEVDSELAKSELYFRNGEYTHALTCVLAIIEKLHPNDYQQKIRENAINAI